MYVNVPGTFFIIAKKLETTELWNIQRMKQYEILKNVYTGLNSVPPKFMSFWNLRL